MSDRIEKFKQRQAEDLAKVEREEALRVLLPCDVYSVLDQRNEVWVSVVKDHPLYGDPSLPTLFDAVMLLAPFGEPLECTDRKGTFRSIRPEAARRDKGDSDDPIIGTYQVTIEVRGGKGFGPDVKLIAWFEIGGRIVRVSVPFCQYELQIVPTPKRDREGHDRYGEPRGRVVGWNWRGVGEDVLVRFASGSSDSYQATYCWSSTKSFEDFMRNHTPEANVSGERVNE